MGLGSMLYVPIVKARDAEITALLGAPAALDVTPLFELQNAAPARNGTDGQPTRAKSTATDASYFLDDIARRWAKPLYLDVRRIAAGQGVGAWWTALTALNALSATPAAIYPVVSDNDPPAERAAAAGLAAASGRAALRVAMPHPNPAGLGAALASAAADLGLTPAAMEVVLDFGDTMEATVASLTNLVAAVNAAIAGLGSAHGEIVTAGTPNSAAFVQAGDWTVTRREWWLWLTLAHAGADVTFGDYVLYPPTDPVRASPNYGHLCYSAGDELHVHRRPRPATGGGLGAAFGSCCNHLVTTGPFLGSAFSAADSDIADAATGTQTFAAAGSWRQIAAGHHFALVTSQLATPPAPPPPGTP